jgi:hypothetical protein
MALWQWITIKKIFNIALVKAGVGRMPSTSGVEFALKKRD